MAKRSGPPQSPHFPIQNRPKIAHRDHPDFAQWLTQEGIVSISLKPDTVMTTWKQLGAGQKTPSATSC